jgi:glycosyltransferase involved in cell wall biosynthesis/GT2 family glycosyltransferase
MSAPSIAVVVPSYRRPALLQRCLDGLRRQLRVPTEIVVVYRPEDDETARVVAGSGCAAGVPVERAGTVAAMIAGVRGTTSEIVAFTDDDAVAREDWIERLLERFADASVGAVGGRDVVHGNGRPTTSPNRIGEITAVGKLVGNHHLGRGSVREVDVLKGVNMAFRREALALPDGLRGRQTQLHFELAASLWAVEAGWRLLYDPSILVDHYPGPRFDTHDRIHRGPSAVRETAYNLVASLLAGRPQLLWRRSLYGLLVGDRRVPGLVRAGAAVLRREPEVVRSLVPALTGQTEALLDHVRGRRPAKVTFGPDGIGPAPPRPTVALVAHDVHDRGGMEQAFAQLVRHGSGAVRFVVVSGTLAEDLRPLVDWRRVLLPRRPFPLKLGWFFLVGGVRTRRVHADLVHTMGAIVPNRADLASIHFCHAAFVERTGRLAPAGLPPPRRANRAIVRVLSLAAERWCYRRGRLGSFAAVSPGVATELRRHYPDVPVVVTPNGLDRVRVAPDVEARRTTRSEQRLPDDAVVALFVGGDWHHKGLPVAVEGVREAVRIGARTLRLWVVGPGDEERFRRLADDAGVADRIDFFGRRADVERFYQAADVFVLPTLYETFSLAAHEAASCGLPLVATRVSGVSDLLDRGGGLAAERTAEAVGSALARLALEPELRARLARNASEASACLTWPEATDDVLAAYRHLLSRAGVASRP